MKENTKPGFTYYLFAVCVVLALSGVAMIPAAMAYNVRTFTGAGLPDWLSQSVSITILLAPGIAVLVTGLTRVFAVALIILAVLLVGCATWSHPYKDAAAFEMDLYTCQVQAGPVQDPWRAQDLQRRCMKLKGWRES